jgi:small subunit ribosomal protein S17
MADQTENEETSAEAEAPAEEETAPEPEPVEETVEASADVEPVAAADEQAEAGADEASTDGGGAGAAAAAAEAPAKRKKKRLPRALRRQRVKPKREKPAERRPVTRLPKPEHERGRTQERQGKVVSAAADKTIVVRVDTVKVHPRYKKVIRRSRKFHAHDEQNEAKVGDIVLIVETRPLSRMKRWRLQKVVEAAR